MVIKRSQKWSLNVAIIKLLQCISEIFIAVLKGSGGACAPLMAALRAAPAVLAHSGYTGMPLPRLKKRLTDSG
jgi:C4-dicarboxylate transporter